MRALASIEGFGPKLLRTTAHLSAAQPAVAAAAAAGGGGGGGDPAAAAEAAALGVLQSFRAALLAACDDPMRASAAVALSQAVHTLAKRSPSPLEDSLAQLGQNVGGAFGAFNAVLQTLRRSLAKLAPPAAAPAGTDLSRIVTATVGLSLVEEPVAAAGGGGAAPAVAAARLRTFMQQVSVRSLCFEAREDEARNFDSLVRLAFWYVAPPVHATLLMPQLTLLLPPPPPFDWLCSLCLPPPPRAFATTARGSPPTRARCSGGCSPCRWRCRCTSCGTRRSRSTRYDAAYRVPPRAPSLHGARPARPPPPPPLATRRSADDDSFQRLFPRPSRGDMRTQLSY